jgi:CHC2 zinc finger
MPRCEFQIYARERRLKILEQTRCDRCGADGKDRFSVNTRKQVFFCRGCGAAGDVIELVRALDGVDFGKAVATLAGEPEGERPTALIIKPIAVASA